MKTLEEYAKLIKGNLENPGQLSRVGLEISADYAYLAALLKPIKELKVEEWIRIKTQNGSEKHLSDKFTDMHWRATQAGRDEYGIELKMKALEKLLIAIRNNTFIVSNELKNSL